MAYIDQLLNKAHGRKKSMTMESKQNMTPERPGQGILSDAFKAKLKIMESQKRGKEAQESINKDKGLSKSNYPGRQSRSNPPSPIAAKAAGVSPGGVGGIARNAVTLESLGAGKINPYAFGAAAGLKALQAHKQAKYQDKIDEYQARMQRKAGQQRSLANISAIMSGIRL